MNTYYFYLFYLSHGRLLRRSAIDNGTRTVSTKFEPTINLENETIT